MLSPGLKSANKMLHKMNKTHNSEYCTMYTRISLLLIVDKDCTLCDLHTFLNTQ